MLTGGWGGEEDGGDLVSSNSDASLDLLRKHRFDIECPVAARRLVPKDCPTPFELNLFDMAHLTSRLARFSFKFLRRFHGSW
jgi:hypothetical protein